MIVGDAPTSDRPPLGQDAGLVEDDMIDLGQPFERRART
jgi:hypothetical protein